MGRQFVLFFSGANVMRVVVSADAQALGILNPVAAVISGVTVMSPSPQWLIEEGTRAVEESRLSFEDRCKKPEVIGFRGLFRNMGYPELEPAGERLARTYMERGFKSINSLVDAYNIGAIEWVSGLGMHDSSTCREDLRVFRASGSEEIIPIFKSKPGRVGEGDLVYANGANIMAWLGRKDVDADAFKVSPDTKEVILVALGNAATSRDHNRGILESCFRRVKYFAPESSIRFLDTTVDR
jgi:DNA/RNA-binding domain of Phe-tRNA-synthetase-like protein